MLNDDYVVVCCGTDELPVPYVPSERTKCGVCGKECWTDERIIKRYSPKVVCIKCFEMREN